MERVSVFIQIDHILSAEQRSRPTTDPPSAVVMTKTAPDKALTQHEFSPSPRNIAVTEPHLCPTNRHGESQKPNENQHIPDRSRRGC